MFREEAKKIGDILESFKKDDLNPVLEIGSSTYEFRNKIKPYIDKNIHSRLFNRGIKIILSDFKPDLDIKNPEDQIIGDVFDDKVFNKMLNAKPKCILLCNILEHVNNPKKLCERILQISNEKTIIIVTVPFSFPYHRDPIDTLFRPSPEELAKNFTNVELLHKEVIEGSNFGEQLKELSFFSAFFRIIREFAKIIVHLITFKIKKVKYSRLLWLHKNYAVSLVVLKKIN
tara:strand:+ start:209 stop:898 length:690 start_codon:yes stop_codon:yes gene_type:complete